MAELQLHFLDSDRHPLLVKDDVPTKGTVYTLDNTEESFVVTLVRRRLWPKKNFDPKASSHKYLAGGPWEVMLAPAEDVASGKVKL